MRSFDTCHVRILYFASVHVCLLCSFQFRSRLTCCSREHFLTDRTAGFTPLLSGVDRCWRRAIARSPTAALLGSSLGSREPRPADSPRSKPRHPAPKTPCKMRSNHCTLHQKAQKMRGNSFSTTLFVKTTGPSHATNGRFAVFRPHKSYFTRFLRRVGLLPHSFLAPRLRTRLPPTPLLLLRGRDNITPTTNESA